VGLLCTWVWWLEGAIESRGWLDESSSKFLRILVSDAVSVSTMRYDFLLDVGMGSVDNC